MGLLNFKMILENIEKKYFKDKKVAFLYTPGTDSLLTDWYLKYRKIEEKYNSKIDYYYVNNHSRCSEFEMKFMFKKNLPSGDKPLNIIENMINHSVLEDGGAHIPNRNLMFISIVDAISNADTILLSGFVDDRASDMTKPYFKKISNLLEKDVISIFHDLEKTDVLNQFYSELGDESSNIFLSDTYSCYSEFPKMFEAVPVFEYDGEEYIQVDDFEFSGCGKCLACFRKLCNATIFNKYIHILNLKIETLELNRKEYTEKRNKNINNYFNFLKKLTKIKE